MLEKQSESVGVIGLGIMGGTIARNLVAAGHRVIGFDPDAARCDEARAAGVEIVDAARMLIAEARQILTSLPSPGALDQTVAAIGGVSESERRDLVVAELSTLPLSCKQANRERLDDAGVVLLDCPLSGTGAQALTRDLAVYASGDAEACKRFAGVFSGFSRVNHYLGEFGNGTKMKLVANLLVAIHNVAAAEAILLGVKGGLDPSTLCEILASGAGTSRIFEMRAPMMVDESYEPATMKLEVWQKDMALIREFVADCGVPTPTFSATEPIYEAALEAGRNQQDTAAVYAVLQNCSK